MQTLAWKLKQPYIRLAHAQDLCHAHPNQGLLMPAMPTPNPHIGRHAPPKAHLGMTAMPTPKAPLDVQYPSTIKT